MSMCTLVTEPYVRTESFRIWPLTRSKISCRFFFQDALSRLNDDSNINMYIYFLDRHIMGYSTKIAMRACTENTMKIEVKVRSKIGMFQKNHIFLSIATFFTLSNTVTWVATLCTVYWLVVSSLNFKARLSMAASCMKRGNRNR